MLGIRQAMAKIVSPDVAEVNAFALARARHLALFFPKIE
jgi:hypothetical protein